MNRYYCVWMTIEDFPTAPENNLIGICAEESDAIQMVKETKRYSRNAYYTAEKTENKEGLLA